MKQLLHNRSDRVFDRATANCEGYPRLHTAALTFYYRRQSTRFDNSINRSIRLVNFRRVCREGNCQAAGVLSQSKIEKGQSGDAVPYPSSDSLKYVWNFVLPAAKSASLTGFLHTIPQHIRVISKLGHSSMSSLW